MTYQRLLLWVLASGWLGSAARRILGRRVWTIEGGQGAGLKFSDIRNPEYILGSSELPVQEALARQIRPGDVFYDVGANLGFFSVIAAKLVGPTGQVYSFEPVTENAASIRLNAGLNKLPNLTPFELAVGSHAGNLELLLSDWNGGASLSPAAVKPTEAVARRTVRVVALDDFIAEQRLRPPTFVKIDVEGFELEVMQGMAKTIAACQPTLLFEVDDGDRTVFERRWRELDDYIAGFGYRIVHLADSYANTKWYVGHSLARPSAPRKGN
jgi:FkbM family methyltransferase